MSVLELGINWYFILLIINNLICLFGITTTVQLLVITLFLYPFNLLLSSINSYLSSNLEEPLDTIFSIQPSSSSFFLFLLLRFDVYSKLEYKAFKDLLTLGSSYSLSLNKFFRRANTTSLQTTFKAIVKTYQYRIIFLFRRKENAL